MIQEAKELLVVGSCWDFEYIPDDDQAGSKISERRVKEVLEDRVTFYSSLKNNTYCGGDVGALLHFELTGSIERRWKVAGKVITITDHLRKVTKEAAKLDDTPVQTFKYTRQRK